MVSVKFISLTFNKKYLMLEIHVNNRLRKIGK